MRRRRRLPVADTDTTKVRTELVVDVCPRSCGLDVVYTTQMAAIPAFRNAYARYKRSKDKAAYYAALQAEIQKRVGRPGLSMQQSMNVLRSLGIAKCEDLRIRLSKTPKRPFEFNMSYDMLLPLGVGTALGALLLTKNCPGFNRADLLWQAFSFGLATVVVHGTAKYMLNKYKM